MPSPVSAPGGGGGPPFDPNNRYVLRLLGGSSGQHVKLGFFWPNGGDLGASMYWGTWVKPREVSPGVGGYLWSDGYGGTHALAHGILTLPGVVTGNMYDGTSIIPYAGTCQITKDKWVHLALRIGTGPAGMRLWTYVNGVCDGETVITARHAVPYSLAAGLLYVGGSDHINGAYDIASQIAYDRGDDPMRSQANVGFVPARFPNRTDGVISGGSAGRICDGFWDFTDPNGVFDTSPQGVEGELVTKTFHHGTLFGNGGLYTDLDGFEGVAGAAGSLAVPQWVLDPDCPFKRPYGSTVFSQAFHAPRTFGGSRLSDSFGRADQTFAFQALPDVGSTEGGSLASQAWQYATLAGNTVDANRGGRIWGILNGWLVYLDNKPGFLFADTGSATQDIRVKRDRSAGGNGETSISFRYVSDRQSWYSFYSPVLGGIRTGYWVDGGFAAAVVIQTTNPGTSWNEMRVTVDNATDTIRIYTGDDIGGWTQQGADIVSAIYHGATKAGVTSSSDILTTNSLSRWTDWRAM